jgi:hypothetical protein
MSSRRCAAVGLALLAGTALGAGGCRTRDRREAGARATAEAEAKAQEVTTTSAAFELPPAALDAGDEALATLRDEQSEYRAKLEAELDAIDARLRSVPAKRRAADPSFRRRAALKKHLDALDRSTAQDWPALKAKIDRDLRKNGGLHERDGHDKRGRGERGGG